MISCPEEKRAQGIVPDIYITQEPLYLAGNAQALRRVFQNIIKNAMDHGEKKISISLQREESSICLEIRNQTQHPEEIDVIQVVERFYKADSARSKNSTGLGLFIAQEFVLRINGQIQAFLEENEFCVVVEFPFGGWK